MCRGVPALIQVPIKGNHGGIAPAYFFSIFYVDSKEKLLLND